jgi:hypothetical protein
MSQLSTYQKRKQSKFQWPDDLRRHIIRQLGAYRSPAAIYKEITDPKFEMTHLIKGLDPKNQSQKVFGINASKIPNLEIEAARRMWLTDWQGVPFATSKGRVQALQEMIGILKSIKDDRTKYGDADLNVTITDIVNNIRKLLKDIRLEMDAEAEREAKAASGTNIYIGRAMSGSDITPELLNDTFIALFAEFGLKVLGLHHWEIDQLEMLEVAVQREIAKKRKVIDVDFEVVEDK